MSTVHVVYGGRNEDVEFAEIFREDRVAAIGLTQANPSSLNQQQIKSALANFYDVGVEEFSDHYVEVSPNGNITVRPNAKFGF